MPVFNAARYLRTAVSSMLGQSFRDFELIAVNDGSTDRSGRILDEFAVLDGRVRVIHRPNTGIVGALNDGLGEARAPLIARMDADDIAEPERLAAQYRYLVLHDECVGVGSAVHLIDTSGHRVKRLFRPLVHEDILRALLAGDGGAMIHPAVMLRAEAVDRVGRYLPDAQHVEDMDLFLRLAALGRLANLPEFLLRYRVHPTSVNFTRNAGRHAVKLAVIERAHGARGLRFDPASVHCSDDWSDRARHHREWAVTSLPLSGRLVAVRHGLRACLLQPGCRDNWRALSYAIKANPPCALP